MAALRRNWRTDAGIAGDITQALAVPRSRANSRSALRHRPVPMLGFSSEVRGFDGVLGMADSFWIRLAALDDFRNWLIREAA